MSSRPLARLPIRYKLVAMLMGTTAVVLLIVSVGYLVTDYYRSRSELLQAMTLQARLTLENSTAALQFEDPNAANETLQTLASNPHLRAACLYAPGLRLFAHFESAYSEVPCPEHPGNAGHAFTTDRLSLVSTQELDGQVVGTLLLRSDLDVLNSHLRMQGLIVLLLLVLTLGVAVLISSLLQGVVADPITALARTANGVYLEGDYSVRAVRTTDDEVGVLVDAFNRMLERIQLREQELSQANDELRREVAERRRAEQERADLLVRERQANRLKDEFLATLSHELRTPLNAILGWTHLLRIDAVPSAEMGHALERVERNAQAQSRLVEDLLEVSRIASGTLRLDKGPLNLVAVASSAVETIRPLATAKGVILKEAIPMRTLDTIGDPHRVQQVIWNLLANAVKFTPPGGTVTIAVRRADEADEVVVSDTGDGIDPAFLPAVFEPFRQADGSSTRTHGGLGLGLSIVRHIVELHGGVVRAESAGQGHGATFVVRLPVRMPAASTSAHAANL